MAGLVNSSKLSELLLVSESTFIHLHLLLIPVFRLVQVSRLIFWSQDVGSEKTARTTVRMRNASFLGRSIHADATVIGRARRLGRWTRVERARRAGRALKVGSAR